MNRSFSSLLRPEFIFFGAIPTALCGLYVALLVRAAIRLGQWPPLPKDAVSINLDPLQSLAFLLAWTGLLGAVMVGVSNKIRDVLRNFEESGRLSDDTRVILNRLDSHRSGAGEKGECKSCQSSSGREATYLVVTSLQFVGRQARRLYAWVYLFWAVSYCVLQLRWALMQVDFPAIGDEITVISVPATAAWTILLWWSFAILAVVERAVHVWRWILAVSERMIRTAKELKTRADDLERASPRISDDQ